MLLLCLSISIAQAQSNYISGQVIDKKTRDALELISIRLLSVKDSSYVNGTATNENGLFRMQAKPSSYFLHISALGYTDLYLNADASKANLDMGTIELSENAILLNEAVVIGKAVEMIVKEDTLEYNASSYKVQETAVIEDMLKKMPGVMIDENGVITVNGNEVKKILIDGKEFFTDDPKIALKNLPAKMIDKLQVIDQKSEMARLTGFTDGEDETVINLTIKPDMKRSIFGDVTAGYGSDDKYGTRGMANYMDDKLQISALAGTNNSNNIGFSDSASDIYAGSRPPGGIDFGGNNGITKSINSGLNFAKDWSKTRKISGDISYGQADNNVITNRYREYIGINRINTANLNGNNKNKALKANIRFEWSFNNKTRIIFRPRVQYFTNDNQQWALSNNTLPGDSIKNSSTESKNSSNGESYLIGGTMTLNHKFSKKGRSLTIGLTGTVNNTDREGLTYSTTTYADPSKKQGLTDQYYTQDDKGSEWRINLAYVEPLSQNNYLLFKYNIQNKISETDKKTYKKENPNDKTHSIIVPNSTREMKNDFLNQNITLNFRSVRKKYNYIVGVGLEPSNSQTSVILPNSGETENKMPRKYFLSFSPNLEFNYIWNKRHNLKIEYRTRTYQATTQQLYDGVLSQSGSDTLRGNPNLKPRFRSNFALRYQKFNPKQASMLIVRSEFVKTDNDIVIATVWEGTKQNRKYENIKGNMNANLRVIYNRPILKKKLSFNTNSYLSYICRNTYINSDSSTIIRKNKGNTYELRENIGLRYNSDLFDVDVRGNITYRNTKNSLSKNNDLEIFNYGAYTNITFYLPFNFLISSDIQYEASSGYAKGFTKDEWMWNFTLAKEMFKKKNGIIRLNVYDILQERSNIKQRPTAQYMEYMSTNTIDSYFMLNFVYKFNIHNL